MREAPEQLGRLKPGSTPGGGGAQRGTGTMDRRLEAQEASLRGNVQIEDSFQRCGPCGGSKGQSLFIISGSCSQQTCWTSFLSEREACLLRVISHSVTQSFHIWKFGLGICLVLLSGFCSVLGKPRESFSKWKPAFTTLRNVRFPSRVRSWPRGLITDT